MALHKDVLNCRRRKSVEETLTTSNRIKFPTRKTFNIRPGPPIPDLSAEAIIVACSTEEPGRHEDLLSTQMETVKKHDAAAPDALLDVHERLWRIQEGLSALNGNFSTKICKVTDYSNQHLSYVRAPSDFSPFERFMSTFPLSHLQIITNMTNIRSDCLRIQAATPEETLKFFGMLVLLTRFSFPNRQDP